MSGCGRLQTLFWCLLLSTAMLYLTTICLLRCCVLNIFTCSTDLVLTMRTPMNTLQQDAKLATCIEKSREVVTRLRTEAAANTALLAQLETEVRLLNCLLKTVFEC
jgi:hypothetical protein